MIFVGLGISVFVEDFIKIISPHEYWRAAVYVPAVALCYVLYALDQHVAFGILIKKKTEYWTYVNFVMGALNLLLNLVLIKTLGLWGAVVATFLSLAFKIVALHIIGRKLFRIPFEWGRMGGILIVAAAIYFTSIIVHPSSLIMGLAFHSCMMFLFLGSLWALGVIRRDEKKFFLVGVNKLWDGKALKAMRP